MNKRTFKILALSVAAFILIVTVLYFLIISGEVKETYYADINAAKQNGLLGGGWIPDIIPKSSFEIYERHDLDTNAVWLRFKFDREI